MASEKKEIIVQFNVAYLKKATKQRGAKMELEFAYPSHLKNVQTTAEQMVDKLMLQMLSGKFEDIKIKTLSLTWTEEE